jgi:hypothetical protein
MGANGVVMFDAASQGGHLEVLKWARGNNCPWYNGEFEAAFKRKHLEVLEWLLDNGIAPTRTQQQ